MQEIYDQLFPIHGKTFETHEGRWSASVTNNPNPIGTDRVCYMVQFALVEDIGLWRNLKLWVSDVGLHHDPDNEYKSEIFNHISRWLNAHSANGELSYFG